MYVDCSTGLILVAAYAAANSKGERPACNSNLLAAYAAANYYGNSSGGVGVLVAAYAAANP